MTKRKYVEVNVSWCNEECSPTTKVSLQQWETVLNGGKIVTGARYWYDGKKCRAYFSFNHEGPGTLLVGYDDGGVGFDGTIAEADITGGEYPETD